MGKKPASQPRRIVNKKARHDYHIIETIEAGIVLTGSEVKSLRDGRAQITEGFVRINNYDVTLYGCQIDRYAPATDRNHDPKRKRPLLLHRREMYGVLENIPRKFQTPRDTVDRMNWGVNVHRLFNGGYVEAHTQRPREDRTLVMAYIEEYLTA